MKLYLVEYSEAPRGFHYIGIVDKKTLESIREAYTNELLVSCPRNERRVLVGELTIKDNPTSLKQPEDLFVCVGYDFVEACKKAVIEQLHECPHCGNSCFYLKGTDGSKTLVCTGCDKIMNQIPSTL